MRRVLDFWRVSEHPHRRLILILQIVGLVWVLLNFALLKHQGKDLFWDLEVYRQAVAVMSAGGDPYAPTGGLFFVYPPLVAEVFRALGTEGLTLVLSVMFAISFAMFALVGRQILIWSAFISAAIFFAHPSLSIALMTGNLTIFLHFFIVASLFALPRFGKGPLVVAVLAASLIKPYYLAYGLALFVLEGVTPRNVVIFLSSILFVALAYFAQYLLMPDMFHRFLGALSAQALGEAAGGPGRDVGRGAYHFFADRFERGPALILHFAVTGAISLLILRAGRAAAERMTPEDRVLFLILIATICAIFLNPRLKVYDWAVLQAAAIAGFLMLTLYRNRSVLPLVAMLFVMVVVEVILPALPGQSFWPDQIKWIVVVYGAMGLLAWELSRFNRLPP